MTLRPITAFLSVAATLVAVCASADDKAACLSAASSGQQLQDAHKLLEARAQFRICAAATCPAAVQSDCAGWLDAVEKGLPTIVFTAKDPSGADLTAVRVMMDGNVLTEGLDGSSLPVDPGEHQFKFEAGGQNPVSKTILVVQGQKDRREPVAFGPLVASAAQPPSVPPPQKSGIGLQRTLALVAGGLGVVGVGVGTAFGLVAVAKKNDAQSACPDPTCSTHDGSTKWSDAGSAAGASTVAFVLGGVALAGGAVLWFTAPSPGEAPGPQVGVGPGGIRIAGVW